MDKITAIELLREVLLGEKRTTLSSNSVQVRKQAQEESAKPLKGPAAVTPDKIPLIRATSETNKSPPISATTKANKEQPVSTTPNAINDNKNDDDQPAYISDDEDEDKAHTYRT